MCKMFIMTDLETVQCALLSGTIVSVSFTVDTVQCALLSGTIVSVSFTVDTVQCALLSGMIVSVSFNSRKALHHRTSEDLLF